MNISFKEFIKEKKRKKNLRRQLGIMETRALELFKKWDDMLVTKVKYKVLEGDKDTIFNEYERLMSEFGRKSNGRRMAIWSASEPILQPLKNNIYFMQMKIEYIDLLTPDLLDEYNKAINEYDSLKEEIKRYKSANNMSIPRGYTDVELLRQELRIRGLDDRGYHNT